VQLFIDASMKYLDEFILKYKLEGMKKLIQWKGVGEMKSGKHVKQFRTNGGSEYTSKKFEQYLKSEGMLTEMTMPYTPPSNGVVEQVNRPIMAHG